MVEYQESYVFPGTQESGEVPVDILAGGCSDLLEAKLPLLQYLIKELDGGGHVLDLRVRPTIGFPVFLEPVFNYLVQFSGMR